MKKKILTLFCFTVLLMTGCTELGIMTEESDEKKDSIKNEQYEEPNDSDQDGYTDDIDLFPDNPLKWDQSHNQAPVAVIIGPIYVEGEKYPYFFYGNESYDTDGEIVSYYWEFCDNSDNGVSTEGNGLIINIGRCNSTRSFIHPNLSPPFEYNMTLMVTDDLGKTDTIHYSGFYDEESAKNDDIDDSSLPPENVGLELDYVWFYDTPYAMHVNPYCTDPDTPAYFLNCYVDMGDGSEVISASNDSNTVFQHFYPGPGTYTINVTARDIDKNEAYLERTIEVVENTDPDVEITVYPTSGFAPLNVSFTAKGSYDNDPIDYVRKCVWHYIIIGEGTKEGGFKTTVEFQAVKETDVDDVFYYVYDEPGEYPIDLTVYDCRGGVSETVERTITVS